MNMETTRHQVLYPLYRKSLASALAYLDGKDDPLELWLQFAEESPLTEIFLGLLKGKTDGIFALGPRTRKDHTVINDDHLLVTHPETGVQTNVPYINITCIAVRGEHQIEWFSNDIDPFGEPLTYVPFHINSCAGKLIIDIK